MGTVSLLISVIGIYFVHNTVGSGVPVLIWGNDGAAGRLPMPIAGHTLLTDSFKRNYIDSVMPCHGCDGHNVVIFLREKLSLNDLTQFGDVYNQNGNGGSFNNIKSYMESDESVTLAAVDNVLDGVVYLKGLFGDNVHEIETLEQLEKIAFDSNSHLVIVKLPENLQLPLSGRLAQNDELVGDVIKSLAAKKMRYSALFTAAKSSVAEETADVLSAASGRHLLAEAGDTGVAVNISNCFLMYYTEMSLTTSNPNVTMESTGTVVPLTGVPSTDGSVCEKDKASISLKWTGLAHSIKEVTLKLDVQSTPYQDWFVENSTLSYTGESTITMDTSVIGAPVSFSYACGNLEITRAPGTKGEYVALTAKGLQVQAIFVEGGKFGYANDCTPFFSAAILSGLIVSFLLIAVLSFGVCMVANITTMDRFDDPKGKPLVISVNEK